MSTQNYIQPVDRMRNCLLRLIKLKRHKDDFGKTKYYEREQPLVWQEAFAIMYGGDLQTLFTLNDLIDAFDAGEKHGQSYISGWGYDNNNGDKEHYFFEKFQIKL